MNDILLYCGVSEKTWNDHPVAPGGYACISPVSGKTAQSKKENWVSVPAGTEVVQDSGAFSDHWSHRLSFEDALNRQEKHTQKQGYEVRYRATYDLLIDEVWSGDTRQKRRWSINEAEAAVDVTVASARWLNNHRSGIDLIISAQGVDEHQYLRCVQRLLPIFRNGDILGLGGWCIIGKFQRQMTPVFQRTIKLVIPFIASEGISRVHIWGVIHPQSLAILLSECIQHKIKVSTDSAGVSLQPVWNQWGYGSWRNNDYQRPVKIGTDRALHAEITRQWLDNFLWSEDYSSHITAASAENVTYRSTKQCRACGELLPAGTRSHKKTCGVACRKALSRGVISEKY